MAAGILAVIVFIAAALSHYITQRIILTGVAFLVKEEQNQVG
jgi:hypothetical protein